MGTASTEASRPAPAADPEAQRLQAEALITAHRIFAALDGDKKSLRWLHGDLFDSRLPVTLSALDAVGTLADPTSLPLLARLLTGTKEEVQCGAVRALGRLRQPKAVTLLMELIKTARSEKVRREILEALASCAAHDRQTIGLLRQTARAAPSFPAAFDSNPDLARAGRSRRRSQAGDIIETRITCEGEEWIPSQQDY